MQVNGSEIHSVTVRTHVTAVMRLGTIGCTLDASERVGDSFCDGLCSSNRRDQIVQLGLILVNPTSSARISDAWASNSVFSSRRRHIERNSSVVAVPHFYLVLAKVAGPHVALLPVPARQLPSVGIRTQTPVFMMLISYSFEKFPLSMSDGGRNSNYYSPTVECTRKDALRRRPHGIHNLPTDIHVDMGESFRLT